MFSSLQLIDSLIAELSVQDTQSKHIEPTPVVGTLEYANLVLQRVNEQIAAGTLTPAVFAKIITNAEVGKVVGEAYPVQFKQATESKQSHLFVIGATGTGKSTFAQRFSEGRIVFGIDMLSYGPRASPSPARMPMSVLTSLCLFWLRPSPVSCSPTLGRHRRSRWPSRGMVAECQTVKSSFSVKSCPRHIPTLSWSPPRRVAVSFMRLSLYLDLRSSSSPQPTRHCVPPSSNAVGRSPAMLGTLP